MAEKKKEKHTTFEIGPISEPRMRAIMKELWQTDGDARLALRGELRDYLRSSGVIWQYGSGYAGTGPGELTHPRHAEELADSNILIADAENNRVIEVNRAKEIVWQYGTTGVRGSGPNQLFAPHSCHRLANGNTVIIDTYNQRVIIVDPNGNIVWSYSTAALLSSRGWPHRPYDAVLLDTGHILITLYDDIFKSAAAYGAVLKITYPAGSTVWNREESYSWPYKIFRIPKTPWDLSRAGGDYLIGDAMNRVFELRDSNQTITWQYGVKGERAYCRDRLGWASHAIMTGTDPSTSLTFITDTDNARIIALDRSDNLVWQYGAGSIEDRKYTTIGLETPDYLCPTKNGGLLVADSAKNVVQEILLTDYFRVSEDFNLLSTDYVTTDAWVDGYVAEVRWFRSKNIQIFNEGLNSANWRIYGSQDLSKWVEIKPSAALGAGASTYYPITDAWRFIRLQVQSTVVATPTTLNAYIACQA